MWDSKAPLQLLSSMPKKLSKENLEKLQMVIDADKYKNSLLCGFDLCEMYAPFCRGCKKAGIYPCAIAYINMLRAGGADVEIDAKPVTPEAPVQFEVKEQVQEQPAVIEEQEEQVVAEEVVPVAETPLYEEPSAEEEVAFTEQEPENIAPMPEPQQKEPLKRKIRIAVARKKL